MPDRYSLYEAKANLSRIVRRIREGGGSVVVTVHGEPAVEIRAYTPLSENLETRWAELELQGIISPARRKLRDAPWTSVAKRPGALQRFLADRDTE